jgi:cobalamin biosynthesis protein CobT
VGSYQPSIEDLRSHREVESFRTFLSKQPLEEGAEAVELAEGITRLADEYARKALRDQAKKGSLRQTIGRAEVPLLNYVDPYSGTAVGGALKLLDWKKQRDDRAASAWARFVIDLPGSE